MATEAVLPVPPHAGVTLVVSFIFALTVLGLSLDDLGKASLYLNPVVSGFTIAHHLCLFTLAIRRFDFAQPTPTRLPAFFTHPAHVSVLVLIGLAWLAVAIAIALTGDLSTPHFIGAQTDDGAFAIADPVLAQSVIGVIESLALSAFASMCFAGYAEHRAEDPEALPSPILEKPLPAAPGPRRKSRPPTWNYLTSFAGPMRKSLLPPSRKARASRRIVDDAI